MEDAVKTPNVLKLLNKTGLYDKLEDLKKRWVPYLSRRGVTVAETQVMRSLATLLARPGNSPGCGLTHPP